MVGRMGRVLLLALLAMCIVATDCRADMTISIREPRASGGAPTYVGSDLHVAVTVQSTYEVRSVSVRIDAAQADMTYSDCGVSDRYGCVGGWSADLSLAGTARGEKTMVVRAVDVFGNSTEAQQTVVYDDKPVVTVIEPLDLSVADPMLRIVAECTDDDPDGCASLEASVSGSRDPLLTGSSGLDDTVSLAGHVGGTVTIVVTGTDSAGQRVSVRRSVYVLAGGRLHEVARAPGEVWDYGEDGRVLFVVHRQEGDALKWLDAAGEEHVVYDGAGKKIDRARLTPHGAMFHMYDADQYSFRGDFYDYRDGSLLKLPRAYVNSFKVAGKYAIWGGNGDSNVYLRDLEAGTTVVAGERGSGTDMRPSWPDLADNGDVVFVNGNYEFDTNIIRYRDGARTRITDDRGAAAGVPSWYRNYFPRTDGINVVYTKKQVHNPPAPGPVAVYLHDGSGETLLVTLDDGAGQYDPPPFPQYLLNGGWTAFLKPSASGVWQVWLRSPSGQESQVSFFGTDSRIDALAPSGEVTFLNGGTVYLGGPGTMPETLAPGFGRRLYLNGTWHLLVGRSVFAVAPNSAPTADAGPDRIVAGDTVVLDGSRASDADGDIVKYAWEVRSRADGSVRRLSGVAPVLTGLAPGFYDVVLTVWDDSGVAAKDEMVLAVAGDAAACADQLAARDAVLSKFDVHGDGVIGLEEAVRALRIVAGMEQ